MADDHFVAAMDDDFNTPDALAALHDLVRAINRARDGQVPIANLTAAQARLTILAGVLGLELAESAAGGEATVEPFIQLLIDIRAELRSAKQWALADRVRAGLSERGVALEDGPSGTTYRFER
jgi:cysteinyl-tRNA synthetase